MQNIAWCVEQSNIALSIISCLYNIAICKHCNLNTFYCSDVEAVSKEVKTGTETTLSCVITGLTVQATITWHDSTGEELTSTPGNISNDEQITTLVVSSAAVTSDAVYTCRVTSGEYPDSDPQDTEVQLNVYSKKILHTKYFIFTIKSCWKWRGYLCKTSHDVLSNPT